jgi:hypothetical protein
VAAGHSVEVDPAQWQKLFAEVMGRVARRFPRVEPRRHARALVLGLLADLPRKNCWTIAEHAGQATPDGLQHLLSGAVWDHDAVRDDVRALVVEHLGEEGAVLAVDETGDLKKGTHTVGVQRQYTGTAGKVDNAQVAVYLAYATTAGHGVVDRELYLPQGWSGDPARRHAAGVPDQVGFATKPELARRMLERALGALAAGAPQPAHRGTGLLRVRRPGRPAADRPGPGGRVSLAGGGGVPGRQGAVRPGPAPGAPLALLVPLGDVGHAGVRVPGGGRGHPARPPPAAVWG